MKKNIIIVALLSVITGSMYGEPVSGYRERPRRYPHKEPVQTQASVQIQDTAPVQQGRTWGQWFKDKAESVNQKVNPYQYYKDEKSDATLTPGDTYSLYGFAGINPYYKRRSVTPEGNLEYRSFELPVRGIVKTGAIAGGAYLAGRWAWNRFMTPEFKKIENKINHATKANDDLITQITNAQNNKKAATADQKVLEMYEIATKKCQEIYSGMKNDVEQHRKGTEIKKP